VKIVKLIFIVLLISCTLLEAGIKKTEEGVEFYWEAPQAGEVYVVGSFNGWNTSADKMQENNNGVWRKVIDLPAGEHSYKFYVDGSWVVDEDNPETKPDGYGGTNSVVVVGESGEPQENKAKVQKEVPATVNTTLNPKVTFNGRYYSEAITSRNDIGRYMLQKPQHDVNLKLNFDLNQNMKAYTVMNINNIEENVDMWKTHLNFKRTKLTLTTEYFSVDAFDRVGDFQFNDPLHLIGDIGRYHYNFGYDQTGVFAQSRLPLFKIPFTEQELELKLYGLIADASGDNDSDVKAARATWQTDLMPASTLRLGYGGYLYQTPEDGTSSQENISNEFDLRYTYDWQNPGWQAPMRFALNAEYYAFENSDQDSVKTKWMDGNKTYVGLDVNFPAALKLNTAYERNYLDLTEELSRNKFMFGIDFKLNNISALAKLNFWTTDFPDSNFSWSDYYTYMERTDGNGRWYQRYSDLTYDRYTLMGYDTGMLWNLDFSYKNKLWQRDYELIYKSSIAQREISRSPRFLENIFIVKYDFAKNWQFSSNTRLPFYNDPFLEIETDLADDKAVYLSNFTQLTYYLRENIELSLGWGVNPRVLNSTTDEFYQGGREEFLQEKGDLTNYLRNNYKGLGEKIKQAESALEDANRIGLEAVLRF